MAGLKGEDVTEHFAHHDILDVSDEDDFDWILTDEATPTANTGPERAYQGSKEGRTSIALFFILREKSEISHLKGDPSC